MLIDLSETVAFNVWAGVPGKLRGWGLLQKKTENPSLLVFTIYSVAKLK